MTDPQVVELARAVSALLGEGWTVRANDSDEAWAAYLEHAERGSVFVRRHWKDGRRLYVSGSAVPHHPKQHDLLHGIDLGKITVAIERGAAAIAKEIEHRLLPTYEAALVQYRGRVAEVAAAETAREHALRIVAGTLDGRIAHGAVHWNSRGTPSNSRATFRPLYDGRSVDVELTIPVELATEIARVLAARDARDGSTPAPFSAALLPTPSLEGVDEVLCRCGERLLYEERHYATRLVALVDGTLFADDGERCNPEAFDEACLRCRTCGTGYELPSDFTYGKPLVGWTEEDPGRWVYYERGPDTLGAGWQIDVQPSDPEGWSWLISSWGNHGLGADVEHGFAKTLGKAQADGLDAARRLFSDER